MAAPALAASIADCAICCGVTGTAGLRPGVSAEPVTAQEIMTLRCMLPPSRALQSGKDVAEAWQLTPSLRIDLALLWGRDSCDLTSNFARMPLPCLDLGAGLSQDGSVRELTPETRLSSPHGWLVTDLSAACDFHGCSARHNARAPYCAVRGCLQAAGFREALSLRVRFQRIRRRAYEVRRAILPGRHSLHHFRS